MTVSSLPAANLHTPEDLLAGAASLLMHDDPHYNRAAVLEAITSLEAYVDQVVFDLLKERLDESLVEWLRNKTRMDFDSRLGTLAPIATQVPIDKASSLWNSYKDAKSIRNATTHSGRIVTREEAQTVIRVVHDWMGYLGSSGEVDLALLILKHYVELNPDVLTADQAADPALLIAEYFAATKAADARLNSAIDSDNEADLVLRFGDHKVVVDVKKISDRLPSPEDYIEQALMRLHKFRHKNKYTSAALVLFHSRQLPRMRSFWTDSHFTGVSTVFISVD